MASSGSGRSNPAFPCPDRFQLVGDLADASSRIHRDRLAFTQCMPNGWVGSLSFREVHILSDCFAAYLREELHLKPGDRVAVQLPNCLAYPVVALGTLKAGCVLVNTNPLYTASEMVHQFRDAEPNVLVIIDVFAEKLAEAVVATRIPFTVVVRITDFFSPWKAGIIRWVQRHVKRQLPPLRVPHVRLTEALRSGDAHIHLSEIRVPDYTKNMSRDSLAVLQYTGGTTGVSKGAMLSHGNLLANVEQILRVGESQLKPGEEVVLTALPLYHILAFTVNFITFLSLGARNILIPSPRPIVSLRPAFRRYPVTWMTGVNTLFNALCNEAWFKKDSVKHLKVAVAGGAALVPAVAQRWRQVTGSRVVEGYGLTEASPVVTFQPLEAQDRDGSVGLPLENTELRLVDDSDVDVPYGTPGELLVRGPQVMKGYWNKPDETVSVLRDGWLRTGDIAVRAIDGSLSIVDRKKDLVLVSGFNVYSLEVEECIARMDGVTDVAVVGVPDAATGEAVVAFVVGKGLDAESIRARCRAELAPYKVPRRVIFAKDLPKSAVGKVLKKELRSELAKQEVVSPLLESEGRMVSCSA